jgi:transposase
MDKKTIKRLEDRYDELLQEALMERKNGCKLRWALKNEKTLLNRMDKYKRNHLLFIHDFDVSFDNNMSERDLRKCKNRQKMSGGFRTKKGKEVFCSIMTITETCKRQGIDLLQAFRSIFQGKHIFA